MPQTVIERMLSELEPGERREHKRSIDPTGTEGRFWAIAPDGRIDSGSLVWANDDRRPSYDSAHTPLVTLNDLEVPALVASDAESPVGDLYTVTSGRLYLL